MKNGPNLKTDERERKMLSSSLAVSAIVAYIYGAIAMIYKLLKYKSMKSAMIEIGLLSIMFIFMIIFFLAIMDYDNSIEKQSKEDRRLFKIPDERHRYT